MHNLKEKLWNELDELDRKEKLSAADVELAHTVSSTLDKLDRICDEGGGYSHAGDWEAEGRMSGNYGHGYSSANRGQHLVRGHYSHSDGRNMGRRGGGYSHADGRSEMMEHLKMAIDSANEHDRENIRRFMHELENA